MNNSLADDTMNNDENEEDNPSNNAMIEQMLHAALRGTVEEEEEDLSDEDDDDDDEDDHSDDDDEEEDGDDEDEEDKDDDGFQDVDVERMLRELIHLYSHYGQQQELRDVEEDDKEYVEYDENDNVDFDRFLRQHSDKELMDFYERNHGNNNNNTDDNNNNNNNNDFDDLKIAKQRGGGGTTTTIIKLDPKMIKLVKARHAELIRQNKGKNNAGASKNNAAFTNSSTITTLRGMKRWNAACPWFKRYSPFTLILIMLLFFVVTIVTTLVLHNYNYNTVSGAAANSGSSSGTDWMLVGGVTDSGAAFRIRQRESSSSSSTTSSSMVEIFVLSKSNQLLNNDADIVHEEILPTYTPQDSSSSSSSSSTNTTNPSTSTRSSSMIHAITIENMLESDTRYYYGTVLLQKNDDDADADGSYTGNRMPSSRRVATFVTAPPLGVARPFTFATAGCAWTGSNHYIFDAIRQEEEQANNNNNNNNSSLLFFLHLGDLHYADLVTNDLSQRIHAIDAVMGSTTQGPLFASTALVYMWDDHDWLGNDSGELTGSDASVRSTALQSYQLAFPHYYPLPAYNNTNTNINTNFANTNNNNVNPEINEDHVNDEDAGGMYHAFTIGTVRFIISDLRSEARQFRIYSETQKEWLYHELSQAANFDFVIWVTTRPWSRNSDDSWAAWPYERQELSLFITQVIGNGNSSGSSSGAAPQNLLVISADAHMLAFDDGTNTYFGNDRPDYFENNKNNANTTTTGSGGSTLSFPLLQSGPLDRLGSTKGGGRGFTSGCTAAQFERNHHYSVVEFVPPPPPINDTNGSQEEEEGEQVEQEACLVIKSFRLVDHATSSKSFQKELVESQRLCGSIFSIAAAGTTTAATADDASATTGSCESTYFTTTNTALVGSSVVLVVVAIIEAFFLPPPPSLSRSSSTSAAAAAAAAACHEWKQHFFVIMIVLLMYSFTIAIGILIPRTMNVPQWDSMAIFIVSLSQMIVVVLYLFAWMFGFQKKRRLKGKRQAKRKGQQQKVSSVTAKKTGSTTKDGYLPTSSKLTLDYR